MTLKRFLFITLLAVLCGMIYTNTRPLPPQITDTPEPLHLKQDEVEIPPQLPYGAYVSGGWERCDGDCRDTTVLEELDSPVSLSVSSSSSSEPLKTRPPFIPHYKAWRSSSSSSSSSNSAASVTSSTTSSSYSESKPLFCFLTGTGSRAEARKNYCESLK